MRTEFLRVKSRRTAKRRAPWAKVLHKIVEGYMAFESVEEFNSWKGTYIR